MIQIFYNATKYLQKKTVALGQKYKDNITNKAKQNKLQIFFFASKLLNNNFKNQ